jgi:hypothetical protein
VFENQIVSIKYITPTTLIYEAYVSRVVGVRLIIAIFFKLNTDNGVNLILNKKTNLMTDAKKEIGIWAWIGRAGVVVALIWGSIQVYNYFYRTPDYKGKASGKHTYYETSPQHLDGYIKSNQYKAAVKKVIEEGGSIKNPDLDSLYLKVTESLRSKYGYDVITNQSWGDDFRALWTFNVKNVGNKPLDSLVLEVPFEGIYKIILPNNYTKSGNFKNRIAIGELRPSYDAQVFCWTGTSYDPKSDEEKSRVNHTDGWFPIDYPIEVRGIIAWNDRNDDMPLLILLFILFIAFIVAVSIGASFGERIYKKRLESEAAEKEKRVKDEKKDIEK